MNVVRVSEVHVAAKCVNVNLQGLPMTHTQANTLPVFPSCSHSQLHTYRQHFTGQCEVGHCTPDTNITTKLQIIFGKKK